MKNKKIWEAIGIIAMVLVILVTTLTSRISEKQVAMSPELKRAMAYNQLSDADMVADNCEYVKFGAYFAQDLNKDGKAEKVLGSCKQIGVTNTLFFDVSVTDNGYLENGKIEITNQNFTNKMSTIKDSVLKQNYVSDNVRTIEFNRMDAGTNEFLSGIISASILSEADYSKTVTVKLTGTHHTDPDRRGNVTQTEINKTIELTVDWYGEAEAEVTGEYKKLYLEDFNKSYIEQVSTYEEKERKIKFTITSKELKKQLMVKENDVTIEFPMLYGSYPTRAYVSGGTYNDETHIATIESRNGAYINNIDVTCVYPQDSYNELKDGDTISFKLTSKFECFNNPNEEFSNPYITNTAEGYVNVYFEPYTPPTDEEGIRCTINILDKDNIDGEYYLSKQNVLDSYNTEDEDEIENMEYSVEWNTTLRTVGSPSAYAITIEGDEAGNGDFINGAAMSNYVVNKGIYFQNTGLVQPNATLKIINDETDEVIKEFTYDEVRQYSINNPYTYDEPVKRIRAEIDRAEPEEGEVTEDKVAIVNEQNHFMSNWSIIYPRSYKEVCTYGTDNEGLATVYFKNPAIFGLSEQNTIKLTDKVTHQVYKEFTYDEMLNTYNSRENVYNIPTHALYLKVEVTGAITKGIRFSDVANIPEDYVLEMVDEESGDTLKTFTHADMLQYSYAADIATLSQAEKDNLFANQRNDIYYFNDNGKRIIYKSYRNVTEGSSTRKVDMTKMVYSLKIVNLKEVESKEVKEDYTLEQVNAFTQLTTKMYAHFTGFSGGMVDEDSVKLAENKNMANLQMSEIDRRIDVTTADEFDKTLSIYLPENSTSRKWQNGIFLIKLPKEFISVDINSVTTSNDRIKIEGSDVYKANDGYAIKIVTSNEEPTNGVVIRANLHMQINPMVSAGYIRADLYAYNEAFNVYQSPRNDTYDINGNENTIEKVGYSNQYYYVLAPTAFSTVETISDYDNDESINVAPNVAEITSGTTSAKVNIQIANNYSSKVNDIVILGRVPVEGSLDSEFSVQMTSDGIGVPAWLASKVNCYYSEKADATKDLTDASNMWESENVDFTKVKSYLIVLNDIDLMTRDRYEFSYDITIPSNVDLNKKAFGNHTVYFKLYAGEDNSYLERNLTPRKVGIRIVKYFDFEVTKLKERTTLPVQGAKYQLKEVNAVAEEKELNRILISNAEGKISLDNLRVNQEYSFKEIQAPEDYELNEEEIKFKVVEDNGNLSIVYTSEATFGDSANITDNTLKANISETPKYKLIINKTDRVSGAALDNVTFKLGNETYTTKNGQAVITGLSLGQEYTIEETYAKGYITEPAFTFTLNQDDEGALTIDTENAAFLAAAKVNPADSNLIEVTVAFPNDKIETYTLEIEKVDEKDATKKLKGATFLIKQDDLKNSIYETTGTDGKITITGAYVHIPGRETVTGKYTLTEVEAPAGYTDNHEEIEFVTSKDANGKLVVTVTDEASKGTFKEAKVDNENRKVTLVIQNKPMFKVTKVEKVIGENQTLANKKFVIYELQNDGVTVVDFAKDSHAEPQYIGTKNENDNYYVTSDADGKITIANLPAGKYLIQELDFVEGRTELDNSKTVEVETDVLNPNYTTTMTGKVERKVPLKNVGFVIYELDENGEILDFAKDGNDNYVGTPNAAGNYVLYTDNDGVITAGLRNGTYKIMEVEFLEGYKTVDNSEVFTIVADKEEDHYYPVEFPEYDTTEPEVTTTGEPLKIDCIEDWIAFANDINSDNPQYANAYVTLERDLDFNDTTTWTESTATTQGVGSYKNPNAMLGDLNGDGVEQGVKAELTKIEGTGCPIVGKSSEENRGFKGVFDGKNHKILNVYINRPSEDYVGLFGSSYYDSTDIVIFKNLTIHGKIIGKNQTGGLIGRTHLTCYVYNVCNQCEITGNDNSAGLIGVANSCNNYEDVLALKACSNTGKIHGSSYTGGLVGSAYAGKVIVEASYNAGEIEGYNDVGGLVGTNSSQCIMVNSYNGYVEDSNGEKVIKGNITGSDYVGGLIGMGYGVSIKNCYNKGTITNSGNDAAGLIGQAYGSKLMLADSYNEGDVLGRSNMYDGGGIVAYVGCSYKIANCHNSGDVNNNHDGSNIGGILGYAYGNGEIKNCYNTGKIYGNGYTSGIIGRGTKDVTDCYNTGNIYGIGSWCRISGISSDDSYSGTITRCHNTGDVTITEGYGYASGIAGRAKSIEGCYNTGAITINKASSSSYCAGIAYDNAQDYIKNCYNAGTIKIVSSNSNGSTIYCHGISSNSSSCKIENCYNTGKIMVKNHKNQVYIAGICYSCRVENCYNTGEIYAELEKNVNVAGIMSCDGNGVVDSYNTGNIKVILPASWSSSCYIGGVQRSGISTRCYNTGNINIEVGKNGVAHSGSVYVGGINVYGNISSGYNTGDITINDKSSESSYSKYYVGGIGAFGTEIQNAYTTGNIYNYSSYVGTRDYGVAPILAYQNSAQGSMNNAYYLASSQMVSKSMIDQSEKAVTSAQLKSDEYFFKLGGVEAGWVKVPNSYPKLNIGGTSNARIATEIEFNNVKETYDITTEIGVNKFGYAGGGTITGDTSDKYMAGSSRKFVATLNYGESLAAAKAIKATPTTGYMISSIKINGKDIPFTADAEDGSYTLPLELFANIKENKNVVVTFEETKYVLTVNKENESHEKLGGVEFSIDQVEDRAEIGSEYKEKVDSAAVKVPDYENEITTAGVVGAIVQQQGFSFAKDGDGKYVPNNNGIQHTIADSYFVIDLSEESSTNKYEIKINASHEGNSYDRGYMYLTDSQATPTMSTSLYNDTENRIAYVSGNSSSQNYSSKWISGGKKYYLHVRNEVNSSDGRFIINSVSIDKITLTQFSNIGAVTVTPTSGNGSYKHQYRGFDLTGVTDDCIIYVKAKNSGSSTNDRGYLTITNNSVGSCPGYNQYTNNQIFLFQGNKESTEIWSTNIYQGQSNKAWIGYYSWDFNYANDKLEIEDFKVYKYSKGSSGITINDPVKTSVDYQFATQANGSYVANNDASISRADAYVPINLTGLDGEYNVVINATTSGYNQYAIIDESASIPTTLSSSSDNNVMCYTSNHSEITGNYISKVLEGNKQYYLHLINYNNYSSANFALNSVKVYKVKEQSLHFNKDSNGVYTSNNQTFGNTIAHSYVPIDLTATRGFYNIIVNAQISSSAEDYGYVYITQSTDMPTISSGTNRLVNISGEQAAADYVKKVEAGDEKIYYVHMIYKKDVTKDAGTDTFTINSITLEYNQDDFYHESGIKTDANGQFRRSLPFGKYKITETEPLDGYNAVEPVTHIIGEGTNNNITITNERSKQVITHYVEDSTDEPLAENEVQNVSVNAKYRTTPKLAIGKYNLIKNAETQEYVIPDNASGTMGTTDINVTYRYEMLEYDYKIKFFYNGTEAPLEEIPGKAEAGKVITYNPEEKDGYVFERAVNSPMTITDNADDNVMEIHYATQYTITTGVIKHSETAHDNTITNNVKGGTISGEDANPYEVIANGGANTLPIEITPDDGYVVKEVKVNEANIDISNFINESTGKVTLPARFFQNIAESKYVTAEFIKKSSVKVQYKVKATETEAESSLYTDETTGNAYVEFTGLEGDSFTAEPKAFAGYKLVTGTVITDQDDVTVTGDSNNVVNGTMYADELVLTYWYREQKSTIIEKHILIKADGTEQGLTSEVSHEGRVGTALTLNRKTSFTDYISAAKSTDAGENEIYVGSAESAKEVTYVDGKTIVVIFFYAGKDGTVTVHYVDKADNTHELADAYVLYGKAGGAYTTSAKTDIVGYTLNSDEPVEHASGTFVAGNIDVYYLYDANSYGYTINYRVDGTTRESTTGTATYGSKVGFDKTKTYPKTTRTTADTAELTITADEAANVLNVDFASTYDITTSIETHDEHFKNGTTTQNVEGGSISGKGANPFETVTKGVTQASDLQAVVITPADGYEIESIKINNVAQDVNSMKAADGSVTIAAATLKDITEDTHIEAKFRKLSNVIVRYVYIGDFGSLYTGENNETQIGIAGYEGKEFTTEQKSFDGYEFVRIVDANNNAIAGSGTMFADDLTIIYLYKVEGEPDPEPPTGNVIVKFVNSLTGNDITLPTIVTQLQGTQYDVTDKKKVLSGYRLDETKLPINVTGIVGEDDIVVTYQYIELKPYDVYVAYEKDGKPVNGVKIKATSDSGVSVEDYTDGSLLKIDKVESTEEGTIVYTITEVKTPDGYKTILSAENPGIVTVRSTFSAELNKYVVTAETNGIKGLNVKIDDENGNITIYVEAQELEAPKSEPAPEEPVKEEEEKKEEPKSTKTGDNVILYVSISIVFAILAIIILLILSKKAFRRKE